MVRIDMGEENLHTSQYYSKQLQTEWQLPVIISDNKYNDIEGERKTIFIEINLPSDCNRM